MSRTPRWHETVKEVTKEIGERRGYDVSESENEVILASKFQIFANEGRKIHTISYKPDVVWKKRHVYRAVFEIEYSSTENAQVVDKRKYSIGSLMLAYMMMNAKSVRRLVFITNSERLCSDVACFLQLSPLKYSAENILYLYVPSTARSSIYDGLTKALIKDLKL